MCAMSTGEEKNHAQESLDEGKSGPNMQTGSAGATKANANVSVEKTIQKRIFKIIVIGDSNVGKTCLTYRFCAGKFPDKTEATIGVDFREKSVDINGENIKLQLWDTAGQERFRKSMVQHYYRNVHAVVFVYDITKQSSFDAMPMWIDECDRHNLTMAVPRILVGNKCDMRGHVCISTNVAQKFADSHNMPLFETSAKDDSQADHVDAIFMTLAHKLKDSKPMMPVLPGYGYSQAQRSKLVSVTNSANRTNMHRESEPCSC